MPAKQLSRKERRKLCTSLAGEVRYSSFEQNKMDAFILPWFWLCVCVWWLYMDRFQIIIIYVFIALGDYLMYSLTVEHSGAFRVHLVWYTAESVSAANCIFSESQWCRVVQAIISRLFQFVDEQIGFSLTLMPSEHPFKKCITIQIFQIVGVMTDCEQVSVTEESSGPPLISLRLRTYCSSYSALWITVRSPKGKNDTPLIFFRSFL